MHPSRQGVHLIRCCIASHESHTGDVIAIFFQHDIEGHGIERFSDVFPQILTMASHTMTWAVGDIYRERDLIRYFLKDHARINVFQFLKRIVYDTSVVSIHRGNFKKLSYPASSPAEPFQAAPFCLVRHSSDVQPPSGEQQRSCWLSWGSRWYVSYNRHL